MKKPVSIEWLVVTGMIAVAALTRLLANEISFWNFSPVAAMALFSGAQFKNRLLAIAIPLACMLITDAFLGFHQGMALVYLTLILITGIGFILQQRIRPVPVLVSSLASSLLFFLITNCALFYPPTLYPHSIEGITASYVAGIPFFGNTVAGDLFFSVVLFGGFALLKKRLPSLQPQ